VTWTVEFTRRAAKELAALPGPDQVRIAKRINSLAENPRPYGSRKLEGSEDFYRIRAGDFRIIYMIENAWLVVLVVRVGHRREVYRLAPFPIPHPPSPSP